jgi:hypothetical protein
MSAYRLKAMLAGAALLAGTMLMAEPAEARFGLRGGPLGVARFAVGHIVGMSRLRHARVARGHRSRVAALRAQDPRGLRGADRARMQNPYMMRAALTAQAALSGWRGGRQSQGWWRHPDGTYGWVGPVFWPFAADDIGNAVLLGDTTALTLYGYGDIYAAIFSPYDRRELAAYAAPKARGRKVPDLASLCDAGESGGLPVDRIAAALQPNEAQRTALDDLAAAWSGARDTIRAACPAQAAPDAAGRLALMQARVAAMIRASDDLAPPLQKFEALLDDGQKQKLEALGHERRAALAALQRKDKASAASADAACSGDADPRFDEKLQRQSERLVQQQWPADEIARNLQLDETGRARLDVLQDTTLRTMQSLSPCPQKPAPTASARLAAVKTRLQAMQADLQSVADALDDFQADLSDTQKAAFETMGTKRGA